jgi:cbb3-type cytochrome oxidase maturation protein
MSIFFILLPLSIFLGLVFLVAYLWSVKNDQFEDLDTPAVRVLLDEE